MGTILASLTYDPGPSFVIPRPYVWGFTIGWWNGTTLVTAGNPTVAQEVPFGGYRVYVKFQEWFFAWDNKTAPLEGLLEDLYAMAPGDSTPINAGNVLIQYEYEPIFGIPILNVVFDNPDGYYWFQAFPDAPADYWNRIYADVPSPPFAYPT